MIPILIICRDRLTCLKKQINRFKEMGYTNLILIDNHSTYQPLLEYYNELEYEIIRFDINYGHNVLNNSGLINRFINDYYCLTDCDVIPDESCPNDFIDYFLSTHKKYSNLDKIGFGLRCDNLPDYFIYKNEVIEWEKSFWVDKIDDCFFKAPIDTTFALCRPGHTGIWTDRSLRANFPYIAEHSFWYLDSNNLPEDEKYYLNNKSKEIGHWSSK
jgi:hypothetical protein